MHGCEEVLQPGGEVSWQAEGFLGVVGWSSHQVMMVGCPVGRSTGEARWPRSAWLVVLGARGGEHERLASAQRAAWEPLCIVVVCLNFSMEARVYRYLASSVERGRCEGTLERYLAGGEAITGLEPLAQGRRSEE